MDYEQLAALLASSGPIEAVTTEPMTVRRGYAGEIELDHLPAGSRCWIVDVDAPGTFLLAADDGGEVWAARAEWLTPTLV